MFYSSARGKEGEKCIESWSERKKIVRYFYDHHNIGTTHEDNINSGSYIAVVLRPYLPGELSGMRKMFSHCMTTTTTVIIIIIIIIKNTAITSYSYIPLCLPTAAPPSPLNEYRKIP